MNLVAGWEISTLSLTTILTVIGFSVHDTIVVFDRIRENIRKFHGEDLGTVANISLWETMSRSLGTQITVSRGGRYSPLWGWQLAPVHGDDVGGYDHWYV